MTRNYNLERELNAIEGTNKKELNSKMTVYGRKITDEDMNNITSYMDDEIREKVHSELAPCTHEQFIERYLELDPMFETLLEKEFEFEVEND